MFSRAFVFESRNIRKYRRSVLCAIAACRHEIERDIVTLKYEEFITQEKDLYAQQIMHVSCKNRMCVLIVLIE